MTSQIGSRSEAQDTQRQLVEQALANPDVARAMHAYTQAAPFAGLAPVQPVLKVQVAAGGNPGPPE